MNYLISYPRSGNSFIRYIIEYLSKRPTLNCITDNKHGPIYKEGASLIEIDDFEPILRKEHHWEYIKFELNCQSIIIILVRNYKDAIISHFLRRIRKRDLILNRNRQKIINWDEIYTMSYQYLDLIDNFDKINNRKLLIYYEDFINEPFESVINIYNILNIINAEKLNNFRESFKIIKADSINLYKAKKLHPRLLKIKEEISEKELNEFDRFIESKNEQLYDRYLKRYKE